MLGLGFKVPCGPVRVKTFHASLLRILAASLSCLYIFWNALWLSQGQLAPSLLMGLASLPGPTTGCTRSVLCMIHGHWAEAFHYNAMTLPIVLLLLASLGCLARQKIVKKRFRLPSPFHRAWLVLMIVAWGIKLFGDRAYW